MLTGYLHNVTVKQCLTVSKQTYNHTKKWWGKQAPFLLYKHTNKQTDKRNNDKQGRKTETRQKEGREKERMKNERKQQTERE